MRGLSSQRPSAKRIGMVVMFLATGWVLTASELYSAEPSARLPVQMVGRVQRSSFGVVPNNDAQMVCEHEDWRTKQWDESRWGGRLHARSQAYSNEKEAWHLYIRGVGPAIHERPVARPYW